MGDTKYPLIFSVATLIFSNSGSPTNLLLVTKDGILNHH